MPQQESISRTLWGAAAHSCTGNAPTTAGTAVSETGACGALRSSLSADSSLLFMGMPPQSTCSVLSPEPGDCPLGLTCCIIWQDPPPPASVPLSVSSRDKLVSEAFPASVFPLPEPLISVELAAAPTWLAGVMIPAGVLDRL